MGLCVCITLVVIQYSRHQTVFQLDYSGRQVVYDQIPGFTICPQSQEAKSMFRALTESYGMDVLEQGPPWIQQPLMDEFRRRIRLVAPNMSLHIIVHNRPIGKLDWDTSTTAKSPIYSMLHNFSVTFKIHPPQLTKRYRLTVMEQVGLYIHYAC